MKLLFDKNVPKRDREPITLGTDEILKARAYRGEEPSELYVTTGDTTSVEYRGGRTEISYRRINDYYRALSYAAVNEYGNLPETGFKTLCYMADMSRNAAYNIKSAKRMIRYLSLMGYNAMMLYCEDLIELEEYPYLGYMRARFTEKELGEIIAYAELFGIEIIPCIETLAHMEQFLKWRWRMSDITDKGGILLAGEEKTYEFLGCLISACAKIFKSRRINLGMDEAAGLGLGRYLKLNGYTDPGKIFFSHLERVREIARENGFEPMIWNDMAFSLSFGEYKVKSGDIKPEIIKAMPEDVTLIYWDYLTDDEELFEHMLRCNDSFPNRKAFAGGAWKWGGFAPHNHFSIVSAEPQTRMCRAHGIDTFIVTGWGDDGAEASQFSILPSLLTYAECAHGSAYDMDKRSRGCFGLGFEELLGVDLPNRLPNMNYDLHNPYNPCKYLLYNDALFGPGDMYFDKNTAVKAFGEHALTLEKTAGGEEFGYMFDTLSKLCSVLEVKSTLSVRIADAYKAHDLRELETAADVLIPEIIKRLRAFIDAFRRQWFEENQPFGFETQELRLGGVMERLRSVSLRLKAYANGETDRIEELERERLPVDRKVPDGADYVYIRNNSWSSFASPGSGV